MNYIVINTNEYNGTQKGVNVFFAAPIKSGEHIGKFATSENALLEFPEIFENLTYEIVDLGASVFEVDATPPTLLPYAVEIPIQYRLPFRNGVFKLNAFEVPLDDYQDTKVVNVAYFQWAEFRAELDTKDANGNFVYQALKDSLMDLWDYVGLQVANQNLVLV
jgi:hypothetical protein